MTKQNTLEIGILNDYYGALLTDHQRNIIDMYYNQDLSLSEISEQINVSRQAVRDIVSRSSKKLTEYESRLGIVKKIMDIEQRLQAVMVAVDTKTAVALETVLTVIKEI